MGTNPLLLVPLFQSYLGKYADAEITTLQEDKVPVGDSLLVRLKCGLSLNGKYAGLFFVNSAGDRALDIVYQGEVPTSLMAAPPVKFNRVELGAFKAQEIVQPMGPRGGGNPLNMSLDDLAPYVLEPADPFPWQAAPADTSRIDPSSPYMWARILDGDVRVGVTLRKSVSPRELPGWDSKLSYGFYVSTGPEPGAVDTFADIWLFNTKVMPFYASLLQHAGQPLERRDAVPDIPF